MEIKLAQQQADFFDMIENSTENFFITGKAGTGKSVLLRYFISHTKKQTAVIAPTGIAAINVGGQTIHSFFGLSTSVQDSKDVAVVRKGLSDNKIKLLRSLDAIVIDEISMVRVDIMDMIDAKLQSARNNNEPFGGCQIIAFGDMFQLPPVVSSKDDSVWNYLLDKYSTIFFFGCPGYRRKPFRMLELTEVHRQKSGDFVEILNNVRVGQITEEQLSLLNRATQNEPADNCITLTPTNAAADQINKDRLAKLPGDPALYRGTVVGDFSEDELPTDFIIKIKPGAQIMMIKNNSPKWVNGTLATVESLLPDCIYIRVGQSVYKVDKETWSKLVYTYNPETRQLKQETVGSFTQYPIKLAYAITIHKSQGLTYDAVNIDYSFGRAFSAGQTYVALSRCKTLSGLHLSVPLSHEDVKVDQEIISFMNQTLVLPPVRSSPVLLTKQVSKQRTPFQKRQDESLIVDTSDFRPKKITGRRLPRILGMDKYHSEFSAWCDITGVFEEPFVTNQYIVAGETIESEQFRYAQEVLAKPGRVFISPRDRYGENPAEAAKYDFFRYAAVFGGMWDYLIEVNGEVKCVLEMKTKQAKNREAIQRQYPRDLIVQGALYAYLLGIEHFYMITSYIEEEQYENPSAYVCTPENTTINLYDIKKWVGGFQEQVIRPALDWYDKHVLTGISPRPVTRKDYEILHSIGGV